MDKATFILIYSESPSNPNLIVGIPIFLPIGEAIDYDILRHEVGTDIPIRMKSLRVKGNIKRYAIEIPWDSKRFIHDENMIILSRSIDVPAGSKISDIRMYIPREVMSKIQYAHIETLLTDCYLLLKPLTQSISSEKERKDESKQSEKQGQSQQLGGDAINAQSGKGSLSSIYWRARVFR